MSSIAMISNYSNAELEEQKVWNSDAVPLLLHLEKELEDDVKCRVANKAHK